MLVLDLAPVAQDERDQLFRAVSRNVYTHPGGMPARLSTIPAMSADGAQPDPPLVSGAGRFGRYTG